MCGIFADISPKGAGRYLHAEHAVDLLRHRGPDARGVEYVELPWCDVTVGMSRLKVVDQSDIPVPYDFRQNLGVVLAYNGEVYNWRSVRDALTPYMPPWTTLCDAEVVAAAWRRWGPACLLELNGMWGLVLIDTEKNEVFIARDRAGEKPVYVKHCDGSVLVASEIKALPGPHVLAHCSDIDTLEFDFREDVGIVDVEALKPGHYIYMKGPAAPQQTEWWSLPEPSCEITSQDAAVQELRALITDAVRIRHVAEVPVAVQLSGGLDSAIVQAVCRNSNLYCVDFPREGVDNITMAQKAAHGCPVRVRSVEFTYDDLIDALDAVAYHLDTPATWTAVCQWFMNQRIAGDGNVVVLSGEGADELFGGYSRYRVLYWLSKMYQDENLAAYGPLIRRSLGFEPEDVLVHMLNRGGERCTENARGIIRHHSEDGATLEQKMMRADFYTTMQVLLRMADRMASAFSLENRSPFLDYRIMEFSQRLHPALKIDTQTSKKVLRVVGYTLGVHDDIVGDKTKKGLFVPSTWGSEKRWDRGWFSRIMFAACRRARERVNESWEKVSV